MNALYRGLGVVVAFGAVAGIVRASVAPLSTHAPSDGLLRIAWSVLPQRVENCRQQTEQELARLPQHMRQPIVCEGAAAEYRLQVRVDGASVADRVIRGGGLRHDRRLYVFEELRLPALQTATIDVRLDRADAAGAGPVTAAPPSDGAGGGTRVRSLTESVPPHLSLERRVRLAPREVILVTYDRDRRELTVLPAGR